MDQLCYEAAVHCPNDTQVALLVAGSAALEARHAFEDHVDDCAACRALVAGVVREAFGWRAGERIGRYAIRERIGQGAMGAVYRADDEVLARPVALKRLHADDARAHARLLREARSAAQLQHPNVIAVYEVIDEPPCLAMEMVDGVTLTAWLASKRRPWREVLAMVVQAGRGLAAAHARGLVHGDFKPDNILVDGDGRARVADFGLANPVELGGLADASSKLARATATGAGTPAYMAPELVNGDLPDARSDLYAFAITLFEALHGHHPFAGATAEAVWAEMALGNIRPSSGRIPAWLDRRVRRGLGVEPADRWPDVAAFVDAIEARPKWPRRLALGGGGAALAASGLALALAIGGGGGGADDCARGASLVDDMWSDATRSALRAGFLAVRPTAAVSIDGANEVVGGWANAWQLGRRAACTLPDAERTPRIACLDRQLDALRAQLEVWRKPDGDTVDNVQRAAAGFGEPAACAAAASVDPLDPRVAVMVAGVGAQVRSGHAAGTAATIDAMLALATSTQRPRDIATALLGAGNAERDRNDLPVAREHYARAAREAGRAGDDHLMLEATMLEAGVQIELGHSRDTLGLLDAADAIDARGAQHRSADIALIRGEAQVELGDGMGALVTLLSILPGKEAAAPHDPEVRRELSGLYAQIAGAQASLDHREAAREALRHVVELDEQQLGPDHPEVGKSLHDLASMELQLQDHPDARAHLLRARAILRAAYGDRNVLVGFSYVTEAKLAIYDGHVDEARADNERALATLTGLLPEDHPMFAAIESDLGEILRNTDHCKDAIGHYERAARILDKSGTDPKSHATTLTSLGVCLEETGQRERARPILEQSIREIDDNHFDRRWRSEPHAALADLAYAEHDKAAAIAYEQQAIADIDGVAGEDIVAMRQYEREQLATFRK